MDPFWLLSKIYLSADDPAKSQKGNSAFADIHVYHMHLQDFRLYSQEWFHFVEQEKQKRQQLALEVDQLTQESTEVREWAFEQVGTPAHCSDSVAAFMKQASNH